MDILTHEDLTTLAVRGEGPHVSVYLPTHRFGPQTQADQTALKNALRDAEELLTDGGMRTPDAAALLAPAKALCDERPFWLRSSTGLALFIGPDHMRTFRLPEEFSTRVVVDRRFHLKPLLGIVGSDRHFWLLNLSQKHVSLMRGSRQGVEEVDLTGVPESLAEALRWDDFEKTSLQFHTGTSGTGSRRPAVFHGTGETDVKGELVQYFRKIDKGVTEYLQGDLAPLVLSGVDYLLPIYREVNSHPALAEAAVTGSPESTYPETRFQQAWSIVLPLFEQARDKAARRLDDAWGSSKTTSDPEMLVPAAMHGRVDTLFVATDRELWGHYDGKTDTAVIHSPAQPGDEDLLDLAAFEALLSGAEVYAVPADELPRGSTLAAILRY
ncbi:MAG: hypothetical protein Q7J82_00395 [Coriobacteriia bacterium]|nr:hypothetical protein [Coriobacteriia bacterium]